MKLTAACPEVARRYSLTLKLAMTRKVLDMTEGTDRGLQRPGKRLLKTSFKVTPAQKRT